MGTFARTRKAGDKVGGRLLEGSAQRGGGFSRVLRAHDRAQNCYSCCACPYACVDLGGGFDAAQCEHRHGAGRDQLAQPGRVQGRASLLETVWEAAPDEVPRGVKALSYGLADSVTVDSTVEVVEPLKVISRGRDWMEAWTQIWTVGIVKRKT